MPGLAMGLSDAIAPSCKQETCLFYASIYSTALCFHPFLSYQTSARLNAVRLAFLRCRPSSALTPAFCHCVCILASAITPRAARRNNLTLVMYTKSAIVSLRSGSPSDEQIAARKTVNTESRRSRPKPLAPLWALLRQHSGHLNRLLGFAIWKLWEGNVAALIVLL
jgi:hypothetical protein